MKSNGYSFIEIMIVMAILAVVSVIAAYSWQHYNANLKLQSAARKVAADIVRYKDKAVAEERTYTITFNIASNDYNITAPATAAVGAFVLNVKPIPDALVDADAHMTIVNFNGGNVATLSPRGMLQDPGTITMENSLATPSTARIDVNLNGRAYVTFTLH